MQEEEAQQSHQALIGLIAAWARPNILLDLAFCLEKFGGVFLEEKFVFADISVCDPRSYYSRDLHGPQKLRMLQAELLNEAAA